MKLLLPIVIAYYLIKYIAPLFFNKNSNKKSKDKIIDADFEEMD
tara:strand:- start:711 stop:842 length:132 start_codon:yes stop_codon:yes gene_type:complete